MLLSNAAYKVEARLSQKIRTTLYRWRTFVSVTFRYVVQRWKCQHEAEGRV